jgi:iron complex outermembrane recepter protein
MERLTTCAKRTLHFTWLTAWGLACSSGVAQDTLSLSYPSSDGFLMEMSDEESSEESSAPVSVVAYLQDPTPLAPIARPEGNSAGASDKSASQPLDTQPTALQEALLGNVSAVSLLPSSRRGRATSPGADAILGDEATFRKTTDTGNLIGKTISARGVSSQQRTPITTDTRVRGERTGQLLATGSYWAPVRMDLDTMMSKIDSRLIQSLIVVKGPYSPRYGPGFSFIDIEMLSTPRYEGGFQAHGTSSADYLSNGQQWYGRQSVFGGSDDWGFRMSYGHRTGNDYTDGDGFELPSSYNSRDVNIALGHDIGKHKRAEFNYLRLDQTGVEYPG